MTFFGFLTGLGAVAVLVAMGAVATHLRADFREAQAEARYGPVGQVIKVDGIDVHVLVEGSGPDLVLIHGASGNLRDFTYALIPELATRYRVIAFDRPGLGWTERPFAHRALTHLQGESPREQARLLQRAADQIGVSHPIVLGHSFGGAVALAWALERPNETAALVALAAVSNPWPGPLSNLYRVNASYLGGALAVPLISAFAPASTIDDTVKVIFAPDAVPDGYADHVGAALSMRRDALRANAQQVWTLRPHIVEMAQDYAATLKMPVEILHGTADTIVPPAIHADVLSEQLPHAVYTRLEAVGHMPQHVVPDQVIAAIDRAAARSVANQARE